MTSITVPITLAHLKNYIRLAEDHDGRDALISYRARMFVAQRGMEVDNKGSDERKFLAELIDRLERDKEQLSVDAELLTSDQAIRQYIEQYALKLFLHADDQNRGGRCDRTIVRMFFSVGLLFDICEATCPLDEQTERVRKTARCKAAQLHSALQSESSQTTKTAQVSANCKSTSGIADYPNFVNPCDQIGQSNRLKETIICS